MTKCRLFFILMALCLAWALGAMPTALRGHALAQNSRSENGHPPIASAKDFVSLFNGRDLTGWTVYPSGTGDWKVVDGIVTSGGPQSHLFTLRDDYRDFVYRIEARINDGGNSGQYFRAAFGPSWPKGYEAQINSTDRDPIRTGSLYPAFNSKLSASQRAQVIVTRQLVKPEEWFTQEVTAVGNHIVIRVNGQTTVDFTDTQNTHMKGRFALQQHDPRTVAQFRKVEAKELPGSR